MGDPEKEPKESGNVAAAFEDEAATTKDKTAVLEYQTDVLEDEEDEGEKKKKMY